MNTEHAVHPENLKNHFLTGRALTTRQVSLLCATENVGIELFFNRDKVLCRNISEKVRIYDIFKSVWAGAREE
jgi:hypothetical protein